LELKTDTNRRAIDRALNVFHINTGSAIDRHRDTHADYDLVSLQAIFEWPAKEIVQRNRPLPALTGGEHGPTQRNQRWSRVAVGLCVTDIASHGAEVLHMNGAYFGGGFSQRGKPRADPVVRGNLALRCHRSNLDMSVVEFNSTQRLNAVEA